MKDYDIAETSYRNGYAAGLAAAGIAPIQWRDEANVHFDPQDGEDYLVTFREFPTRPFLWRDCVLAVVGRDNFTVWLWCPIQIPSPDFCEIGGSCGEQN